MYRFPRNKESGMHKLKKKKTIAGQHQVKPLSAAKWPVVNSTYPSEQIKLVSFKENSGAFSYSGHYYQERFNFR